MGTIFDLRNVSYTYVGTIKALRDIGFKVDSGEQISKRAIVMGEDHGVVLDGDAKKVLDNVELLLSANLIHEHMHIHGKLVHEHLHAADREHMHEHVN